MRAHGFSFALSLTCLLGATFALQADPLPGTKPLTLEQSLDVFMIDGIDKFCLRELAASVESREKLWKRDYTSIPAYIKSIEENRKRFKTIIGAVDPRATTDGLDYVSTNLQNEIVAQGKGYTVAAVRWKVLDGVTAEGLVLQPKAQPIARVIAIPDADWTPEMIAGLAPGLDPKFQYARRLVEQGCTVLVPTLISREDTLSGSPDVRFTNQTHREFIYRQAFEMGRHVIGYEVQKIMAAVDELTMWNAIHKVNVPIGVIGVGEGGLLALYSAAADPRIDAAVVSGYFQPREGVWEEPIYRNVWALTQEFGDAGIASLIAPRSLTIEAAAAPESAGPPAVQAGRGGGAAPGKIVTPDLANVRKEFNLAAAHYKKLKMEQQIQLLVTEEGRGPACGDAALSALLKGLKRDGIVKPNGDAITDLRMEFSPFARQKRQFDELQDFTQKLVRGSAKFRDNFWAKADRSSIEKWESTAEFYRDYVYDEMIGRLPAATMPPNVRTRQILDEPAFRGYEVVIDVYPDVIAGGILLLPKDLKPDEKRPVVVCQHGLEGVPMDTISKTVEGFAYYKAFTAELATQGFITYAPQNPYRGKDRFRTLQRKSNPMKRSLFSYIIPQHQRTLDFLGSLPNVDPKRIGFYGLSYGGKTAVRVPPMLKGYALSICSADYNEWVVKNTCVTERYSYMFTGEYEIVEWNMGHVCNYSELANLMTPRPFMVERGHGDGVAPDEWVAWEYAKVRRHYDALGIGDKTEIEFFNGPHTINGKGTYEFLHKQLNWPKRQAN